MTICYNHRSEPCLANINEVSSYKDSQQENVKSMKDLEPPFLNETSPLNSSHHGSWNFVEEGSECLKEPRVMEDTKEEKPSRHNRGDTHMNS